MGKRPALGAALALRPRCSHAVHATLCVLCRILKGKYSEKQAARLIQGILRTVAQCHSAHVLMRDIKPENVGGGQGSLKGVCVGVCQQTLWETVGVWGASPSCGLQSNKGGGTGWCWSDCRQGQTDRCQARPGGFFPGRIERRVTATVKVACPHQCPPRTADPT